MRNPGVFSLVLLRKCYIAQKVMRVSQMICSLVGVLDAYAHDRGIHTTKSRNNDTNGKA